MEPSLLGGGGNESIEWGWVNQGKSTGFSGNITKKMDEMGKV